MTLADKISRAKQDYDDVYNAGKAQGGGGGTDRYDEGVEAGKKAQHREFWENFVSGRSIDMSYAFYGWNASAFYPKVNMAPYQTGRMFYSFNSASKEPFNLKERLEECGVTVDFSLSTNVAYMFSGSYISDLPELKFINASKLEGLFNLCTCLETIEKLVLKDDGTQTFVTATFNATALKHIEIEGKIGTDITFQVCPLTVTSMKSIITHLVNYSGTDKAYTYTVKFSEACWEALEADSTSPTGTTWAEYVDDLGWNK
jgi:hypothetical protein